MKKFFLVLLSLGAALSAAGQAPGWEERYIRIECTQLVGDKTETRRTRLDRMIVLEDKRIYGHRIEAEVLKMKVPYTSFFYLRDTDGEILDLSPAELDEGQRVYSMAFTRRDAKKFPFYQAIEPVTSLIYALGKFASADTNRDGAIKITPENAPEELRVMAEDYFSDMQKGYILAVPGRMETSARNDKARALLQQHYLRFFGRDIEGLYSDGDLGALQPVTLLENFSVEFPDGRRSSLTAAYEEEIDLFNYMRANPEKETAITFSGDATARQYTFELPFYAEALAAFGAILTPFTMRFDVRTFYDSFSDATYFMYFYSMGYEIGKINSADWTSDDFAKEMRDHAKLEAGNYRLETMDVMVGRLFATFEKVTVTEEEFITHAIRASEYLTFSEVIKSQTNTYLVDCSWLQRVWVPAWPRAYIPVVSSKRAATPDGSAGGGVPDYGETIDNYEEFPDKDSLKVRFGRRVGRVGVKPPPSPPLPPGPILPVPGPEPPVGDPPVEDPPVEEPEPVPTPEPGYTVWPAKSAVVAGIDVVDIAEDYTHTYLAGRAGGTSRLVAIDKRSGEMSTIHESSDSFFDHDKGAVKRMLADGRGGVLVQFTNHPVMLLRSGRLSATKLPGRVNYEPYPHLKAVMPDGGVVLSIAGDNARNILVDPASGEIGATTTKMATIEPKIGTVTASGGTIWEPAGGVFAKSYSIVSGLGNGAEPVVTSLDISYSSPFKGRVTEIKSAPDGGIVLISGFGLHRTGDGGKTWSKVDSKTLFEYGGFDRIATNSRSEVWAVINTTKDGYTLVRYNATLGRLLLRVSEFGEDGGGDGGGAPVKLKNAPKLLFVDRADNLWMVSGTYGSPGVTVFNPSGLVGYDSLAAQKTVTAP
ncbi:MAG: hypothetical protein LBR57_04190 [Alistipes sp.]|jgi:hypothetical protein|nr:hypothetical protein [Alistipes sp.]